MRKSVLMAFTLSVIFSLAGCGGNRAETVQDGQNMESVDREMDSAGEVESGIALTGEIVELEKGFSTVCYDGDYGFDEFLSEGGASSDKEVVGFLTENLLAGADIGFNGNVFGCSAIAVQSPDGEFLFGRNFDWNHCEAMWEPATGICRSTIMGALRIVKLCSIMISPTVMKFRLLRRKLQKKK